MQCPDFQDLIPELIDGFPPDSVRVAASDHLRSCHSCQKEFEAHQQLVTRVSMSGKVPFPAGLHARILSSIPVFPQADVPSASQVQPRTVTWPALAGVVGGLVFIAVGLFLYLSSPQTAVNPGPTSEPALDGRVPSASYSRTISTPERASDSCPGVGSGEDLTIAGRVLVAAGDSGAREKGRARFVCSGRNDENLLLAAFNALGSLGGTVELEAGTFRCSGVLFLPQSVFLRGQGPGKTVLRFEPQGRESSIVVSRPKSQVRGMTVVGPAIRITARDCLIERVERLPCEATSGSDSSALPAVSGFEVEAGNDGEGRISFRDCSAADFSAGGFRIAGEWTPGRIGNVSFSGCSTKNCGRTISDAGFIVGGGSRIVFENCSDEGSRNGWIIGSQSSRIELKNCVSQKSLRWGIWMSGSRSLRILGFRQSDPKGAAGFQSMNGVPVEGAGIVSPVSDSEIEIVSHGASQLPQINPHGPGNRFSLSREP